MELVVDRIEVALTDEVQVFALGIECGPRIAQCRPGGECRLTRLDLAWSRDAAEKSYVQYKMLENGDEIWKWIDNQGGHFFVCGDARRMAKDVDAALRKIIQEKGGKSEEETNQYVEKLKADKRYKRDVY